jgi:hypothetical protein
LIGENPFFELVDSIVDSVKLLQATGELGR